MPRPAPLPSDVESLQRLVREQQAQLLSRDVLIEQLKLQLARLKKMKFGRSSEQLDAQIDHWILCGIQEPRGLSAPELRARFGTLRGTAEEAPSIAAGCARARALGQAGERVVVFGSFHAVGPALEALELY